MKSHSFFRWLPTGIILWSFAVIFTLSAALNVLWLERARQGFGRAGLTRWYLHGAVGDMLIAAFCVLGWHLMRLRLSGTLALGALSAMAAMAIICYRAIFNLLAGHGYSNWGDLVVEPPFLLYAIIYATLESKKTVN